MQVKKCYCPVCKTKTNHTLCGEKSNHYEAPDDGYFQTETFYIAKCCGCGTVTFLLIKDGTEYECEDNEGFLTRIPEETTYPIKENNVDLIDRHWTLPCEIYTPYHESVGAINANCPLLAALGLRATVEAICLNKGIHSGNLETKIEQLKTSGLITQVNKDRLDEARFMGNESAHELKVPSRDKLLLALEVVNNMLHDLYVLDEKCKTTFEYKFKNYDAFKIEVGLNIDKCRSGDTGTIFWFLTERKYDNQKVSEYETQLESEISSGAFTRLRIKTNEPGKRVVYEVV